MFKIKRIVVAVDFSADSGLALRHASLLAKEFSAEITVFHACGSYGQEMSNYSEKYLQSLDRPRLPPLPELAEAEMSEFVKEHSIEGLRPRIEIQENGRAAHQILQFCEEAKCDLLVMGSHGRSKLVRLLLGSVAHQVLKRAKCPVLLVRSKEDVPTPDLAATYERILIGTDFSAFAEAAVAKGLELAKRLNSEVDLVHIIDPDFFSNLLIPTAMHSVAAEFEAEMRKKAEGKIAQYMDRFTDSKDFLDLHVLSGKPAKEILNACNLYKVNLVILGAHGASNPSDWVLGSTAERVAERAPCPVLIMNTGGITMDQSKVAIENFMTPFPHTIGSDQLVAKAKDMMKEYRCRHLPVKLAGKLVGVLSESDLRLVDHYEDLEKVKVEEVMTTDIYHVKAETPVHEVAKEIIEHHYSSALVTKKTGELLGIFTWVDLAKAFLALCPKG